jgi:hypothetical protein
MANSRYGLKEVANVIFFDIATNKPVIFFDTLKVSTIANDSQSAEATGGQGNNRLMSWDYGRTATLTLQDALLSDTSLAMLAGSQVNNSNVTVVGRETLVATGTTTVKVTLKETPNANSVTVFKVSNGILQDEVTTFTVASKDVTFDTGVVAGDSVMVFYEYTIATGATQVTFSGNMFPATYRVVGDTVVRGQDGVDRKMQFVIAKAKLQSKFSLTMEPANVSTFDFTLDVLVDQTNGNKLYDIIRLDA